MKFSAQVLLAAGASAFPAMMLEEAAKRDPSIVAKAVEFLEANDFQELNARQTGADSATAIFEPVPKFDGVSQLIDVSAGSGHAWQAPRATDNRGPCPGLNVSIPHVEETSLHTYNIIGICQSRISAKEWCCYDPTVH